MLKNNEQEQCEKLIKDKSVYIKSFVIFVKHLFGYHDSCCMVAGVWSLKDHKRLRGPMCLRTRLPLILPKNRRGGFSKKGETKC